MNLEKEMEAAMYLDCGSAEEDLFEYVRIAKQYAEEIRQETIKDCIEAANELELFDEHESARSYIVSAIDKLTPLAIKGGKNE